MDFTGEFLRLHRLKEMVLKHSRKYSDNTIQNKLTTSCCFIYLYVLMETIKISLLWLLVSFQQWKYLKKIC